MSREDCVYYAHKWSNPCLEAPAVLDERGENPPGCEKSGDANLWGGQTVEKENRGTSLQLAITSDDSRATI